MSDPGTPARRPRARAVLRAVAFRTPGLGPLLRERNSLRMQRDALQQDAEHLRVAVGQLLTEVHKYRT